MEELESTLFLNGSDSIRAKLKEILPEYSHSSDYDFKMNAEEEPRPSFRSPSSWPV
jgi:hypothetical protein